MSPLDHLQRRFGRLAVAHVTEALIFGQVAVYILSVSRPQIVGQLALIPDRVLGGEPWRLVSFLVEPPLEHPIFAFFFWYLFYLMGTSLEATWGVFRYNVFLLIGYLATVAVSFITPAQAASALFLQGSVFLAFAHLYPNFQLLLFFLLPIRIKWLALLTWMGYFYTLAFGPWQVKLGVLAAVLNFLVFFGKDILLRIRSGRRRMAQQARQIKQSHTPRHVCRVCGKNDLTHRQESFRYCSKCAGACCYCREHLRNHVHVVAEQGVEERT